MTGGNKVYLIIIALLIIVIIGFIAFAFMDGLLKFPSLSTSSQAQLTPKQMLVNRLALINTTPSYEATYNVSVPALSSALGLLGISNSTPLQALVFKSGNLTKIIASVGTYTIALYGIGKGNFVICDEYEGFSYSSAGLTCAYQNSTSLSSVLGGGGLAAQELAVQSNTILGILNETNVTYLGNRAVAGRGCDEFRLVASQKEINSLLNASENYALSSTSYLTPAGSPFNGSLTGYLCLDKQTGLPLSLNLSENYYNQLLSENKTTPLLTVTASNVGTDVPSSVFNVPVSFAISSNNGAPNCTPDSVSFSFVSFRNTTNSTVKVSTSSSQYNFTYGTYTYNNQTASVNLGKSLVYGGIYKVNATFAKNITSAQSFGYSYIVPKICVDGYCSSSDSCVVYSYYNAQNSSLVSTNSEPEALIYDNANKYVYVADYLSGQVSVLNGTTLVANINVSSNPSYLAYNPYNKYVYEASDTGNITVINNTKVVASINLDYYSYLTGIAYDAQNHLIYLSDQGNNTVDIINGTNIIKTLYVVKPGGIAYDPKNGLVYVSNFYSEGVTVIRNESVYGNVTATGTYYMGEIGVDNATGYIYLSKYDNIGTYESYNYSLQVINGTQEIGTIELGSVAPVSISFDSGNGDMYFVVENSSSYESELLAVNGTSIVNTITGYNDVGYGSVRRSIAYDPGNGYLYDVNPFSDSVSVFNGGSLVDTIGVGSSPNDIMYNPSNGYMYVTNLYSGTVSVIDGSTVIATINV